MKKYWLIRFLVIIDIAWSIAAWFYDRPVLSGSPPYLWPIMIVCPLYPLLLAYVWHKLAHRQKPTEIIYILALFGGCIYGVLAPIYYTEAMITEGFSWLLIGAIFWVWFYSIQSWYLLFKHRFHLKKSSLVVALIYFVGKISLDYNYKTFGYISFDYFSQITAGLLFTTALLIFLFVFVILLFKNLSNP